MVTEKSSVAYRKNKHPVHWETILRITLFTFHQV